MGMAIGANGALDIGRVRMRLEGLQAYATLGALLANACLRLYSSVKEPNEDDEKTKGEVGWRGWMNRLAMDIFLLCVVVSVLSGSYVTVIFSMLSLYSKTALGRGFDEQFLQFFAATASLRERGFASFLYCLASFEMAFILSLALRFKGRRRILIVSLACLLSGFSISQWSTIMHLATVHLFPAQAATSS